MAGKKVLTFGTFDIFHPGHEFHLREALKHGDSLHVVVALDSTVQAVKGRRPHNSQVSRLAVIAGLDYVDSAVLGNQGDKYAIVSQIDPDVIFLGYDQTAFTDNLQKALAERGLNPRIVRSDKALMPEKYKSSMLRKQ
ncbi:FAD synthase [Candidatus Woesearchaeota archaeon]|nr:FAD synthase [Candidatus Woesearchaeota archaeon]